MESGILHLCNEIPSGADIPLVTPLHVFVFSERSWNNQTDWAQQVQRFLWERCVQGGKENVLKSTKAISGREEVLRYSAPAATGEAAAYNN